MGEVCAYVTGWCCPGPELAMTGDDVADIAMSREENKIREI
jgi:hypothetical protein